MRSREEFLTKRRKYKSFDPAFSIGEIEDFSLEFRYAELPTVEQGLRGQSPSSTSAEVSLRETSVEIPKTRFDFVKTEKVPFFASCIYKVNAFLAKGKKEEMNSLYTKNGCRISEIFP